MKTKDNEVNERISFPISAKEKEELYDLFANNTKEYWENNKLVSDIVNELILYWIGDKKATVRFKFDQKFIK